MLHFTGNQQIILKKQNTTQKKQTKKKQTKKQTENKTKTVRLLPLRGESNQSRGCPGGSWYPFFFLFFVFSCREKTKTKQSKKTNKTIQKEVWTSWICYLGGGLLPCFFLCFFFGLLLFLLFVFHSIIYFFRFPMNEGLSTS